MSFLPRSGCIALLGIAAFFSSCTEAGSECATADLSCHTSRYLLLAQVPPGDPTYYGAGQVASSCAIQRSADGANWDQVHSFSDGCTLLAGIVKFNDVFVAAGGDGGTSTCRVFFSYDGFDWIQGACPTNSRFIQDIQVINGQIVAVGVANGSDATIMISNDGINWTQHSTLTGSININALTFANNTYYFATGNGIYTSSDPTVSTTLVGATSGQGMTWIAADNLGRIFSASASASSFYSQDGVNFFTATLFGNNPTGETPNITTSKGRGFLTLGGTTNPGGDCFIDYSDDGINWHGGYPVNPYCTVAAPLYYLPVVLVRAGDFYFVGGYENSTGSVASTYLTRSINPLDQSGWTVLPMGTELFRDIIALRD